MKKNIIIILTFIIILSADLYSSGTEYTCKQMDGCTPTGYTTVFELEWVSQSTLQITVSERVSQQEDDVFLYNLTTYPPVYSGNKVTINGGTNTKLLPFNATVPLEGSGGWYYCCDCMGEDDNRCVPQGQDTELHCANETCPECCDGYVDYKGEIYQGGGIVVDAPVVVFVSNE